MSAIAWVIFSCSLPPIFRGLLTKDVRGTCFNVSFVWVFLFSYGCLNLRWLLRLEVPPWSCSVIEHRLHVADFLSAAFVKNFHTWDAVGGILNVDRMRSSMFNVDVDWMSNWLRMTMFYPRLCRSSNEVFVTYAPWKQYIVLIAIHRHLWTEGIILLKLKLAKGFWHKQLINNGSKVGSIIDGLLGSRGDGCRGLDVPWNIQRVN